MRGFVFCFSVACMLTAGMAARGGELDFATGDLTDIPMEKLVGMEVFSASIMARQISDAPSMVTVVTSADIRAYGYRTLADIVNSMPGLYTPYDRSIYYLGGRGFGRAGDFSGRIMLMIDGYATNDNIYSEAYIGNDFLLDTELIERVEYVPGSGSSVYGNNAFFGIINVITRKGRDFGGTQVAGEVASYGTQKGRITFGKQLENGADVLLSASILDSDGQNLFFPEFNNLANDPNFAINHGVARNHDYEHSPRLFGKLQFDNWVVEGAYVSREHGNPTGAYNSVFNAFTRDWDTNGYLSARVDNELGPNLKSSAHAYYGYYLDRTAITRPILGLLHEFNRGQWWGVDAKFVADWFKNHKLVFGAEYRDDFELSFSNIFNRADYSYQTISLYLQDEIGLTDDLRLNVGGRYDRMSGVDGNISPRVALIYSPTDKTTLKASYNRAYRFPSAYERFYKDDTAIINPNLGVESVSTAELVLQHQFSRMMRVSGSLYHYRTSDLITQINVSPAVTQFVNSGNGQTDGIELALERNWDNGVRFRGSYAHQSATDTSGQHMINSPDNLGKLNVSFPLRYGPLRAGVEVQYNGARLTETRAKAASYTLTNVTVSTERPLYGWGGSLSIRNLFDRDYVAVAPGGYVQDTLQMDGLNLWLQLTYDFK